MASMKQDTHGDSMHGDNVSISDYFRVLSDSWRLVCMVALGILALGAFYGALNPPMYRADALIQIGSQNSSSSDAEALGRLASIFDSKVKAGADTEMELIRSRLVVGETVRQLHLEISAYPRYFPVFGQWIAKLNGATSFSDAPFGLRRFAWGDERIDVSKFDIPHSAIGREFLVKAGKDGSYELIAPDGIVLGQGTAGKELVAPYGGGEARLVVNELYAPPGCEFTLTANSTLATILALQSALAISERKSQSGMIGIALEGRDPSRVADIVNTIAQEYRAQDLARRSSEAEHSLLFLEGQLPKLRAELQQAEDQYNAFRNSRGTVDLSVESRLLLQQVVDLDTAMRGLMQQRDDIAERYQPGYPALAAVNAKIARMQQDREALSRRIATLPDTEQTALRLMRDVRVDTELYTSLLNSAQQLRVIKAGNVGNVRIVDRALPAEKAIKPNWRALLSLSAALGVALGIVAAFLRKAMIGGVERSVEIERALGVPVCAVVPHSERQVRLQEDMRRRLPGVHVLAARSPCDVAVEGVRSLRTALQSIGGAPRNNVIMITSSTPGAGKSFLSANLAAVQAAGGKRVLLIDADMRMGNMHASFAPAGGAGLRELLNGAAFDDVVQRDVMDGVDLIPRGGDSLNPADILMSRRLSELIDAASMRYDSVVIDTPPVLAVTDATLIGRQAGTTLFVVRHGRHSVAEVHEALSRLQKGGVSVSGVLFTDVPADRSTYGSGYGTSYRYSKSRGESNIRTV
ncbi:tyrosine-protein kinase involved in EPS biosynthesis [Burkholderia sp. THE68]|uniref:polysaccharide biosynthesis tyrosine autokinase n=1 Tax=Burkholderia sp. THE68 TaxID=758782 RepID=UPI0013197B38|nr:polysaccharide biosynthesis tyrosine autokinase [Burkholderia sp. THE68]BBU31524.1 tyrosine-protein kinase involved in EPS biosynthesis [Burkholderia sp. THE68]